MLALRAIHSHAACRRGPQTPPKSQMLAHLLFSYPNLSLKQVWLGFGYGLSWDCARTSCYTFPCCLPQGPSNSPKKSDACALTFFIPQSFAQTGLARIWVWFKLGLCSHFVLYIPMLLAAGALKLPQKVRCLRTYFFHTPIFRSNPFGSDLGMKKAVKLSSDGFLWEFGWKMGFEPTTPSATN